MNAIYCSKEDDILKYLVSWLNWIPYENQQKNGDWIQEFGFRRGFINHQIWYNTKTTKYIFYTSEFEDWNQSIETEKFNSFSEMLKKITANHNKVWNVEQTSHLNDFNV
jgi:hypothetical protein